MPERQNPKFIKAFRIIQISATQLKIFNPFLMTHSENMAFLLQHLSSTLCWIYLISTLEHLGNVLSDFV